MRSGEGINPGTAEMARVFAITNQKGGVGKTTTSVNLAAALAAMGKKVLLIDSDAQAHATKSIGFNAEKAESTLHDIYRGNIDLNGTIQETNFKNLWLIPSDISLSATDVELAAKTGKEFILNRALEPVRKNYDFIFIDCPPFLGILTINALIASTDVLVTSTMSYLSLEGVSDLLDLIEVINDSLYLPESVEITGVLACMYDGRTIIGRKVRKELDRYFGRRVFNTEIPVNVTINDSQTKGVPVVHFAPSSKGAQAYVRLAKEILRKRRNVKKRKG